MYDAEDEEESTEDDDGPDPGSGATSGSED